MHPEAGEDSGDLRKLGRGTDPNRPVSFRSHSFDGSEPLGIGTVGFHEVAVDLLGYLDEGVVGRHLGAIESGQAYGKLCP
jgi:hypothetical protein